mmetsp:Transcript_15206/g.43104  ORF Transcript_15206/g.43104 Transcript_15206/m.43104 type:complete len:85 (+) Transcript_15206:225-479(+)
MQHFTQWCLIVIITSRTEGSSLNLSSTRTSHLGSLDSAIGFILWNKFYRFSISQTAESLALNFRLVDKDIGSSIVRNNKAISLQ